MFNDEFFSFFYFNKSIKFDQNSKIIFLIVKVINFFILLLNLSTYDHRNETTMIIAFYGNIKKLDHMNTLDTDNANRDNSKRLTVFLNRMCFLSVKP